MREGERTMRFLVIGLVSGIIGLAALAAAGGEAWAGSKLYDMTRFLNEPYPLTRYNFRALQTQPPAPDPAPAPPPAGRAQAAPAPAPYVPLSPAPARQEPSLLGSDWEVTLGAGVGFGPEYMGADDFEVTGFPIVSILWRDRAFLNYKRGLGYAFKPFGGFATGPMVNYALDQDAEGDISALDDVEGGFTAGWFLDYAIDPVTLTLDAVQGVSGDNDGLLLTFGADYPIELSPSWRLGIRPSVSYATEGYMDAFFGVSPAEAARSPFALYTPDGGFRDVSVALRAIYAWDRNWRLVGLLRLGYLLGEAADSPIVEVAGDAFQISTGLGVAYRF